MKSFEESLHQGNSLLRSGASLGAAQAAAILLHGRGASAASILALADELSVQRVAYLAPQAAGNTWYPNSFLAPIEKNEPYLSSALSTLELVLDDLARSELPARKTIIMGFSQGACLSLEFAARHAQRFGGVIALSGGLIGPDEGPRSYPGSLSGTPIFLGCSDIDFHIPLARVHYSAEIMRQLGGEVTERIYPNLGHTVNDDELEYARGLIQTLVQS